MRTQTKLITAVELLRMRDNGMRQELLAGEVRESPPPGREHGRVAAEFLVTLGQFVKAHDLGAYYAAETGFVLSSDPDTVRAPDAAFVTKIRLRQVPKGSGYFPGAPDLAVEVLSPGDRPAEVNAKVEDWLAAGCRMVVVVDPRRRTVKVHRRDADVVLLTERDTFDGEDVVPGFRLPVASLFAE